jgi:uncharacterized delta-60 repeat protein
MSFTRWLTNHLGLPYRPASRRKIPAVRPGFRPTLEALEARWLLSAGALDPTFGGGGVASPATTIHGFVGGVAVYPNAGAATDGDVVAAGTILTNNAHDFTVVRYTKTGTPDSTFGTQGEVITPFNSYANTQAQAVVIQGDGKIVAVGYAGQTKLPGNYAFALARYTTSGSLDKTFGKNGQVLTNFHATPTNPVYYAQAYAAVLQPADGKIVVAGITNSTGVFFVDNSIALARYNPDGSLDSTFGSGGKVITPHTTIPGSMVDPMDQYGETEVLSMALQADGKILVGGYTVVSSSSEEAFFARYSSTGTLDTTFGNNGIVTLPVVSGSLGAGIVYSVGHMAVEPSGEIVVTGWGRQMALLQSNGTLDTGFGTNGMVATPFSGPVALEPNGQIVVSDSSQVARYVPSGALDPTFGTGGVVTLPSGAYGDDLYHALAIQPDGKIDVVGGAGPAQYPTTLIVARLLPSEPEIGSFTASFDPVMSGTNTTLTASSITDGNPNATITQVTFYYYDSTYTQHVLGYGTQTNPGIWTLNDTVALSTGTYMIYAQTEDSYGVFGDPIALTLQVL